MDTTGAAGDGLTNDERIRRNDVLRSLLRRLEDHAAGELAHAERVAVYAVATGHQLGLRGEALDTLRYTALLHDLGKLRVPSELLTSAEPLSQDERTRVSEHIHVQDLLYEYEFLRDSIPMIEAHHERWDGQGYPLGSEGIEIPFGARIVSAAEVFDVLLHGAAWRPKFPEAAAIAAMRGLAGSWFEAGIVDALLKVHPVIQPHEV